MADLQQILGKVIRQERQRCKLTMKELGEKAGPLELSVKPQRSRCEQRRQSRGQRMPPAVEDDKPAGGPRHTAADFDTEFLQCVLQMAQTVEAVRTQIEHESLLVPRGGAAARR